MELYHNQKNLLNSLIEFATNDSSENVCIVEGFSGTGKRSIARQLQIKSISRTAKAILLSLPDGVISIDDFYLDLAAELSSIEIYGLEEAISTNKPLPFALRKILEKENIWIIATEFHNAVDAEGKLNDGIKRLLSSISAHVTKGKVVAFSNQTIERGDWSSQVDFKKLDKLSDEDALLHLEKVMHDKGIVEQVERNTKIDIIRILGSNIRAINTFTESWRWASDLNELIGEIPEIWETRDQEISSRLLQKLEEQLVRKSLDRFNADEVRILEGLSVIRKPFQKEAIERMFTKAEDAIGIRDKMQQYFFLDNNLSWFSLHPIVKEISKLKLSGDKVAFQKANAKAAEYYTRHFTQSNLKKPGKLGGYFVEARYHLIMAQSEDRLQQVSANFEYFIRAIIKPVSPIPTDPQLLDERIGLLTAFLGSGGPKGLEFHLAKCLEKRGMEGDDKQALIHAERAIGLETPVDAWLLKMRLEVKVKNLLTAIDTGYIAISRTQASQVVTLYVSCAELMDKAGQVDEAIKLLKDGIAKIPAANSVVSLYQACAELMDKAGQVDQAIELLKKGIETIPAAQNSFSLYQSCAELMDKAGQVDEAIKLLKDGIAKIPAGNNAYKLVEQLLLICYRELNASEITLQATNAREIHQRNLAKLFSEYVQENYDKAKEYYGSSDTRLKKYVAFVSQIAFGLLSTNSFMEADSIVSNLQAGRSSGLTWLLALSALKNGKAERAKQYYEELHAITGSNENITINDLVRFWYDSKRQKNSPFYFFPHLPKSLTGYHLNLRASSPNLENEILKCLEGGVSNTMLSLKAGLNILAISTEWFSRNGGLSTFNRLLCESLSQSGNSVCCLVPEATDDERQQATVKGVTLIEASVSPGFNSLERLNLKPLLPIGFAPDIIMGHDRITGPPMVMHKTSFFPDAKAVLFIHTAPAEIEWYKPIPSDKTISQKSEEREQLQIELSKKADSVIAVGKKLFDEISTQLSGVTNPPKITQFTPGILSDESHNVSKTIAAKPLCLILGRVEDFELKGVDIAAKALGIVSKSWQEENKPVLVIRGAQVGTGDDLKKRVQQIAAEGLEIRTKEYSHKLEIIKEEINRASVVLMPSRTEGFGLVGLEAIEAKCPVLISSNSGLAKMLKAFAPSHADNWIVTTTGNLEQDAEEWAKRIKLVLADRVESNRMMEELFNHLKTTLTWSNSVAEMTSSWLS